MPKKQKLVRVVGAKGAMTETKVKQISYAQAKKAISNTAETKFFNEYTWASGATSTSTAGVGCLTNIPQETSGALDTVREGDEVYIKSFQCRLYFTVADTYNVFRFILFQWNQDDTPVLADILQNTTYPLTAQYRKDTNRHYKILADKTIVVDTYNPTKYYKFNIIRGFKRRIKFDAGTTTGQNKIYFLNVSDSGVASHPSYYMQSTVNYMDY